MSMPNINRLIYTLTNYPAFFIITFCVSWFLMALTGRSMVEGLKGLKGVKWSPREDTPDSHVAKAGTPSMGGIGLIGAAVASYLSTIAIAGAVNYIGIFRYYGFGSPAKILAYLTFPALVSLHAVVGLVDDWSKARGKGGLKSRQKLAAQIVLASAFILVGRITLSIAPSAQLGAWSLPLYGDGPSLSFAGLVFLGLIVIASSNALNLTDGIDGLAAGLSLQCGLAMGCWPPTGYRTGEPSVSLFWLALAGASLGFLTYNRNPAKVFMGDTGSLALGAALGAGAILTRKIFLLPFIGFVFYVEMFSVIAQVAYFKYTKKRFGEGRRIFRRAPLHHHFELAGWSEWRVVGTFWLANAVTSALGLYLWNRGFLPNCP